MDRDSGGRSRGASGRRKTVTSWADLQRDVKPLVDRVNRDQSLALAAASNPLLALEELGYEIDPSAQAEIEDRLRFRPREAKRIAKLRRDLHRVAGREFDPASDAEVRQVLDHLGVKKGRLKPSPQQRRLRMEVRGESGRRARVPGYEPDEDEDPFEKLRDEHEIIEPLLEYRRLDRAEPRLASRDVYLALRTGERKVPLSKLRYIVKADRER